jgi:hypothetical protein
MSSGLVAAASLKEFFRTLLTEAIQRQRVELAEFTEFYLVNLLSDFVEADRLFAREEGRKAEEALALMYGRALQQQREERIRTLRRLGDVSLYKAGFFSSALREGPVGPDYYIRMGGAAYGQLAELSPAAGFAGVYRELEVKFRAVVDVLEEIAARGLASNGPGGALKVYETWVRTGDEKLERVLVDVGLVTPRGLPN